MKTREQVIEELKSAGLWNEDVVNSMSAEFVEAALDFFRFTEEKYRIEKEQKEKELYESIARMMDNPHSQNAQCVDVDLGVFKRKRHGN
jgi:hypothetical protein